MPKIDIEEYLKREEARLQAFRDAWEAGQKRGDNYPSEMGEVDWWDQYMTFVDCNWE